MLKCQLEPKEGREKRVLLCPGLTVHQCLIVLRNLGCICNETVSVFSSCHQAPDRMIASLLFVLKITNTDKILDSLSIWHKPLNVHVVCLHWVYVNYRRKTGDDKRRTEGAHSWARGHVWRVSALLQLHPYLLCHRYQTIVLASWFNNYVSGELSTWDTAGLSLWLILTWCELK